MFNRTILLFDVMDTLVYNPFNNEIPAFFAMTQAALLQHNDPTAWDRFERGQISEQEYLSGYFRDRRLFDHTAFRSTVAAAYRWLDMETVPLLKQLKNVGYEIHAFSNYPIWYRTIEDRLRLSEYLHWTFVSCLTGIRKPALEAFHAVSHKFARPASDFLFVDDCPSNCHAAQSIGMDVIHYTSLASLREGLVQRHILSR